ncbi:DUF3634 family protein [Frigoriglobus tundricola]|uniref:DUF3634 family protein n=1 Tax=Frigoriglobus tundricola TaxID=2774151 RepID=A0A6M5Z1X2_9BACT|nr:DUF3634 family protein [Frigoriglobus tundricola]QJW99441.1 hypothetical protein FTUN_7053 [Frigoriglobus tundricola]
MDVTLVWVIVVAALVIWFVAKPDAVFVVRVRAGHAEATAGTVTTAFCAAVVDVCQEFGVRAGQVRGVARGRRIALRFSTHFPPAAQQRLRNWWAVYGWSAPRR